MKKIKYFYWGYFFLFTAPSLVMYGFYISLCGLDPDIYWVIGFCLCGVVAHTVYLFRYSDQRLLSERDTYRDSFDPGDVSLTELGQLHSLFIDLGMAGAADDIQGAITEKINLQNMRGSARHNDDEGGDIFA